MLALFSMMVFYFICGGSSDSWLAIVATYFTVLGVAFTYASFFLMVEFRAPPELLGSTMVVVLTIATLVSGFCPHVAYME